MSAEKKKKRTSTNSIKVVVFGWFSVLSYRQKWVRDREKITTQKSKRVWTRWWKRSYEKGFFLHIAHMFFPFPYTLCFILFLKKYQQNVKICIVNKKKHECVYLSLFSFFFGGSLVKVNDKTCVRTLFTLERHLILKMLVISS